MYRQPHHLGRAIAPSPAQYATHFGGRTTAVLFLRRFRTTNKDDWQDLVHARHHSNNRHTGSVPIHQSKTWKSGYFPTVCAQLPVPLSPGPLPHSNARDHPKAIALRGHCMESHSAGVRFSASSDFAGQLCAFEEGSGDSQRKRRILRKSLQSYWTDTLGTHSIRWTFNRLPWLTMVVEQRCCCHRCYS